MDPRAGLAGFIKRTTIHCYTQNMKALGLVVSEKIFSCFSHDAPGAGPVWTPGAWLAGFIKRTSIHCYTQNMKALGLVLSEKIFLCFSHCMSMRANDPRGGAIFDPRGMVGRIYKEDHHTLLHTKYESSGPCGFGKDFLCFSHDAPAAGPVWMAGAQLAGFIKRTSIHCYTQVMKALGLVVLEKYFFLCFSHCMPMGANDPRGGAIFDSRGMVGRIYKEDHYTLLHTKYESSGPCGFREEVFLCFSYDAAGAGPIWTPGARLAGMRI